MKISGYCGERTTTRFASTHNIDIDADAQTLSYAITPRIALQGKGTGDIAKHITVSGAEYDFVQLDYLGSEKQVVASRMIALIQAGNRTELAYWTPAAPKQRLDVHKGLGRLVIARPDNGVTRAYPIDADVTAALTLQPDRFYTIQASPHESDLLVVSGLYNASFNWESEVSLEPGQKEVVIGASTIRVPEDFRALS